MKSMLFWIVLKVTKKKIENLKNDSDTEFVDRSVVENKDSDMHADEEPETTSNDAHSNLISTHLPIQDVVREDVPEEESSDDETLITLAKQKEPVWKWRKRFAKTPLQPSSSKDEGVVNMQTENVTHLNHSVNVLVFQDFFL